MRDRYLWGTTRALLVVTLLFLPAMSGTLWSQSARDEGEPTPDSPADHSPLTPPPFDLVPPPDGAEQIVPVGTGDSLTLASGEEYVRGGLHRFMFGDRWRDLWGTPITVPYLDLRRTAGGLTPTEIGGGRQTTSLRFMGANGREYKFRSVNKEFRSVLPDALQKTFVDNVLQDNISAQNPVGALVVAPLQDAVDVLNATPYLYVLPDDPALGKFREDFAGLLGTLEEHPNEEKGDTPGFMGYRKIVGDDKIYEKLAESNHNQVDYLDYLKVRLIDILIGDWSRHIDQYRWAEVVKGSESVWRPIPRDRDMAFSRYDGLLPWIATGLVPELVATGEDYPDIEDLTWTGKILDRRFLAPITHEEWDSVTSWMKTQLTDQVIRDAVRMMPPEYYLLEGEDLTQVLLSRRDQLPEASSELFSLIHQQLDLWGSDEDEVVEVDRLDNDHVRVSFYRRTPSGEAEATPYLQKTFDRDDTKEIRLILREGDDRTVVRGNVESSITIRVDGGAGTDEYVDESKVEGYFFITPIPDAETATYFLDADDDSKFALGPGTRISHQVDELWRDEDVAVLPPYRDYGNDFTVVPWIDYSSSDNGFTLGIRPSVIGYGFRKEPFAWKQTVGIGYAFGTQGIRGYYEGNFRNFIPNARVLINGEFSELTLSHFYGFGNGTVSREAELGSEFHDVGQEEYSLITDVQIPEKSDFRVYFGLRGSYTTTSLENSPLLDSLQPYGTDPTALLVGRTGLVYDSRDIENAPTSGLYVTADGEYFPPALDNRESFAKGRLEARTYLSAKLLLPMTLALRGISDNLYGNTYPYFEAVYLGGSHSLRGFEKERFSGESMLAGSAELRLTLFNYKLLVPSTFGLVGFTDIGRTYLKGESVDTWHSSYGGGIALSFIDPGKVVTVTVAKSDEGNQSLYLRYGYSF